MARYVADGMSEELIDALGRVGCFAEKADRFVVITLLFEDKSQIISRVFANLAVFRHHGKRLSEGLLCFLVAALEIKILAKEGQTLSDQGMIIR